MGLAFRGECDELYQFSEVFEALLVAAVKDGSADTNAVNAERLEVLKSVYNELSEIIGTKATLKLYPRFASGSVSIEIPEIHFEGDEISRLRNALSKCNTFELIPLSNGGLRASVTVKGVFNDN